MAGTRETYPGPNETLARAFATEAFQPDPDSLIRPVGEALRLAKGLVGANMFFNSQKYALQSEPE